MRYYKTQSVYGLNNTAINKYSFNEKSYILFEIAFVSRRRIPLLRSCILIAFVQHAFTIILD